MSLSRVVLGQTAQKGSNKSMDQHAMVFGKVLDEQAIVSQIWAWF
ncbi:hypothetical protein [Siphonobacter curvatus]|nr:hypothetical protein [Siphonobacter curvatus]